MRFPRFEGRFKFIVLAIFILPLAVAGQDLAIHHDWSDAAEMPVPTTVSHVLGDRPLVMLPKVAGSNVASPQELAPQQDLQPYTSNIKAMGVRFRLLFFCQDQQTAESAFASCRQLLDDIEYTFTDYDPRSEAMRLCQLPTSARFPASERFVRLAQTSQKLHQQTQGCFDVTLGSITSRWRSLRSASTEQEASIREEIQQLQEGLLSRADRILFRVSTETLTYQQGELPFRFDFGGIAKGFAADEIIRHLRVQHGITRAMVDASGDITTGEPPPGQPGWQIGLSQLDPEDGLMERITLKQGSVASSGDARQFWIEQGKRKSHLFDPRTGKPIDGYHLTVVVHPSGAIADALASALSVCRKEEFPGILEAFPDAIALRLNQRDGAVERQKSETWDNWIQEHSSKAPRPESPSPGTQPSPPPH